MSVTHYLRRIKQWLNTTTSTNFKNIDGNTGEKVMELEKNEIELLLIAIDSIIVPDEIQLHPKDRTTAIKKRAIRKLNKMKKEKI
jgi:hypothetical protein